MSEQTDFKHIIRIANTDLDGNRAIMQALRKIKGVSFMMSNAICAISRIDRTRKAGTLSTQEAEKLTSIIEDPLKNKIPEWMVNRRNDVEEGGARHILTGDLKFWKENDIKILQKIKSYRGSRHAAGLPCRGQRTKSNFRKNKGKVSLGVKSKPGAKKGK